MGINHEVVKRALEASHVTPIQVLGRQMDALRLATLLCKPNLSVTKHTLSLTNTAEECVALFINDAGLRKATVLSHRLWISDVIEFDQILG